MVDETAHSVSTLNQVSAPVAVGHNAQAGYVADGVFDRVRVYDRPLSKAELATTVEPTENTVLWYDFDNFAEK